MDELEFLFKDDTLFYFGDENKKPEVTEEEVEEVLEESVPQIGDPSARVHVWVNYPDSGDDFFPPTELELLKKILSAVQVDFSEVFVCNALSIKLAEKATQQGNPSHLLKFGIKDTSDFYQWQGTSLAEKTLLCDPLAAISQDVTLKKSLWNALKGGGF
ncbi:MAG: hypothetical protein AAF740_06805 [Bacteroidota bacterium]